jgi:hypothetical protein
MKVVFLDFDGVLNSTEYTATIRGKPYTKLSTEWWAEGLDPKNIELLNRIVGATSAKVVVSSSWRINAPTTLLALILDMRGFTGEVIDKTALLSGADRSDEIQEWLDLHPEVDQFVILDDNADAEIEGHFVQTDMRTGLTVGSAFAAIDILDGK